MRRITQVFLAVLAAIPILVGFIFFVVYLFSSDRADDKPSEPEANFSSPSDWLLMLMMTFQGAYPYMAPAVLVRHQLDTSLLTSLVQYHPSLRTPS